MIANDRYGALPARLDERMLLWGRIIAQSPSWRALLLLLPFLAQSSGADDKTRQPQQIHNDPRCAVAEYQRCVCQSHKPILYAAIDLVVSRQAAGAAA